MTPFESPNYTQTPNDLFDKYLSELSGSQIKVLLVIIRKTIGFVDCDGNRKKSDLISISQIMKMSGLSNRVIIDSLKELENKYTLIGSKKAPGNTTKYYLQFSGPVKKSHRTSEEKSQDTSEEKSHTKETNINKTIKNNPATPDLEFKNYQIDTFNKHYEKLYSKKFDWSFTTRYFKELQKIRDTLLRSTDGDYKKARDMFTEYFEYFYKNISGDGDDKWIEKQKLDPIGFKTVFKDIEKHFLEQDRSSAKIDWDQVERDMIARKERELAEAAEKRKQKYGWV